MNVSDRKNITRWILIFSSFVIVSLILWNTNALFQTMKKEERKKMELWAEAQKEIARTSDLSGNISNLTTEVIISNTSTPAIILNQQDEIVFFNNIDEERIIATDSLYLTQVLERIKKENDPIVIKYQNIVDQRLYYGDSPLLKKIQYYPLALLLIIFLFGTVIYFLYKTSKISDQNKLWAGMAKETAHQIGTPLSSLFGWLEILKTEDVAETTLTEIEKDIDRLKTITERFSKIGSLPELKPLDVVQETQKSYDYLKARSSKLINFDITLPKQEIFVNMNEQLYGWTIENLVKNAIDAMKGKGELSLALHDKGKQISITVTDSGKGIPKALHGKIFEPGFTSKKRGWGLGLSLSRRIIETYHKGTIRVKKSEIGKGTTMEILLKKI